MTILPLRPTILGTNSNQGLIVSLSNLMTILSNATTGLETYIKTIKPTNQNYKGTNEDITKALEALQEGLTGYTAKVLEVLTSKSATEELICAIKLVETYLQETCSLDKRLATLKELDTPVDSHPKFSTSGTNFPAACKPLGGGDRDLYEVVPCVRQSLSDTLNTILDQLNLNQGEVDIQSLVQESRKILSALDDFTLTTHEAVAQLISHLKKARDTFKQFKRNDISLNEGELKNIRELVSNWEKITQKLQALSGTQDFSDSQANREAIAQSIHIHDLLEANYDDLTALVRSSDLESAGIL